MSVSVPNCVVVAGMHRSGTSLVAGLLEALGVAMGPRYVPADRANPYGYFEDLDIVRFHQRLFRARFPDAQDGHADWGWTPLQCVHPEDARAFTAEAVALIEHRNTTSQLWGFKDPRTTVLLDFWNAHLPAPVYVMVYRDPSGVADSMQRLGADVFLRHPEYARRIWSFYNRQLLTFVRQNRERCILLNADALNTGLERLPGLLRERFGLPVAEVNLRDRFARELWRSKGPASTISQLSRSVWPDCATLYEELEAIADLPEGGAVKLGSFTFRPRVPSAELSIVIPTYNDATWLVDALASAEECTDEHHEILVFDDGTTDTESLRILDRLREAGQPVHRQVNMGLAATRNRLIEAASGEFILPLDADNRIGKDFVNAALKALRTRSDLGVVYGDRQLIGGRTELIQVPDFNLQHMVRNNTIDACAMFRRDLWRDIGGYDTSLRLGFEDWEFWLNAWKRGWQFQHLPLVGLEYRVRPDSLVTRAQSPEGRLQFRKLMLHKHADLLLTSMPARLQGVLSISSPIPHDFRKLPLLTRMVLYAYWKRFWAHIDASQRRSTGPGSAVVPRGA
jgi:glycosyltransferase involved in cell wall biosynthesis